ncbi:hypothetical protein BTO32_15430 [Marinobacter lutaoensis]|uniref:SMODS and SLOG-associating 2TM effector domain-containing protein n=1 Tax=Marinobacter lutaoensis TaxID=135739 RepID=A0A1V2DPP5_9GAMM|nr:hypothetical protein [Marinobacter lutaoensis]ONF42597.1 hypothetical protein BTO32_15430 [Marinobacter lutaoensis]
MTDKFRGDLENDDSGEIEQLRSQAAELENKSTTARARMFWALNVALLSLIGQGLTGNWETLAASTVLLFLMGIGTDYYTEKRLWSFSFFRDSVNCLVSGWKARLRPKSATE